MVLYSYDPASPLNPAKPELVEKNKIIKFKGTATKIEELAKATTISNARLPITLQSEAFLGDY